MREKLGLLCFVVLANALVSTASIAMEFAVHPGNKSSNLTAIRETGAIEDGDLQKFQAFLDTQVKRKNTAIYLGSTGGNLYEGFRLGKYFHDVGIKTVLEGGMDCASACAIAFLGGADAEGNPWRSSSTNSRLGFHAFKSELDLTQDEVQYVATDLVQYGRYVDAPMDVIVAALQTPSTEIYWVSNAEICQLGIKLWSVLENRFLCE